MRNFKLSALILLLFTAIILLIPLILKSKHPPKYNRIILDHYFQRGVIVNERRMALKGISLLNVTLGKPLREYYKEEYPQGKISLGDGDKLFNAISRTKKQKLLTQLDVGSNDLISGFDRDIIIPAEMDAA